MSDGQPRRGRLPLSVRTHVFGLILVTLLPLLGFSAFLVLRSAKHEQALLATTVQDGARATARDVERELASLRSQLFLIANAWDVSSRGLGTLYRYAADELQPRDLALVLTAPDGKEVLDTRAPFGAVLPDNPDRADIREVVRTGRPLISDLTRDGPALAVMLDVPVLDAGKVAYVASMNVIGMLQRIIVRQQFPSGWLVTVGDRHGFTLARSLDPQRYVGQLARASFLRRVRDGDEGWFPAPSREGIPLNIAFSHVQPEGWIVVVGIPSDVLYAPVRHSTHVLLLVGAVMSIVALLLALLIGQRIGGPIRSLVSYATLVGQGAPVPLRLTGLRETDAVACSLHRASENLHHSRAEREHAAAALLASEQRKAVLHQAVLAQENERRRIARELHDSLGQYLTALQLGLNGVAKLWAEDPASMVQLASLRDLTRRVSGEVNRMAWELRPTALDDLGLETAITQYLEEWSERSNLHFDLQVDLAGSRLPPTVETTVYRALQEAVTNVVRHAYAENVAVILGVNDRQLQMIVEDDGKGFLVADAGGGEPGTLRLGLLGIRERLALVEGTLEVESTPGRGTSLFVRVPV